MYQIDIAKVRRILIEDQNIQPQHADRMLKDFPPIQEPLAKAVQRWLEDQMVLDVNVKGFTIQKVMQDQGYHFLVAVKILNKLLDETIPEEERKKLLEALRIPAVFS